ncbi:glucosaminidase domain-containing protein [Paenibacillus sp. FSL H7-0735]|uniref:glycoside hydrolase family 73 protein n=1 Tax=Paenibacillus sp. FSL H7-0735 TaxID=2954736 RepID=UPI0030FCF216
MTKYSKAAFFALLAPTVVKVWKEGSKMLPSVRLAQNWLETGGTVNSWNNLGGYKVGSGKPTAYWDGSSVNTGTWEVYNSVRVNTSANWRKYSNIYNFYKDQDLLFAKSRYNRVCAATTPETQTAALFACGYATDPAYASKLMSIIKSNNLTQYDAQDGEDNTLELANYQWAMLQTQVKALLDSGAIQDKSWLEKIEKKTLTTSELSWLSFIVAKK